MVSLKHYCSEEIAQALDAQLKNEGFVGLYKQAAAPAAPAPANWWDKGPTAKAYKTEVDNAKTAQEVVAVENKYLAGGELTTALAREGIDDHLPLREYADAKVAKLTPAAEDGGCPEHAEAQDGCPACADAGGLAVAFDFAIRHMVKVADALDKVGFPGIAGMMDETLQKLAAARPIVAEAKQGGRSYEEWSRFFGKKGKEVGEKFRKTYKGALEHAKGKGMKADKAEEYAMRTALDKMPKSYFEEPGSEHGPGKSGPLTKKR